MKRPIAARLAWGVWALTIAMFIASLILFIPTRATRVVGLYGSRPTGWVFTLAAATVGALIASSRPRNPIGWIFCAVAVLGGLSGLSIEYSIFTVLAHPGSLPGGGFAAWLQGWAWIPGFAFVLPLFLLFPTGTLLSRRWGIWMWIGFAGIAMALLGAMIQPGKSAEIQNIANPYGIPGLKSVSAVLQGGQVIFDFALIAAAVSLVIRLRRARGEEREQIRWLVYVASVVILFSLPPLFLSGSGPPPVWLANVFLIAFAGIPLAAGVAILKYRLYDIDLVINKTVVLAVLAAFVTLVYVVLLVGVGRAVGGRNVFLSVAATAIVAVLFQPVLARARRLANRIVYGKRATPYEVLSEFSERVGGAYAIDEMLPRMARILAEGTGATRADVWLAASGVLRSAASWPPDQPFAGPMPLSGDTVPDVPKADRVALVRHQGETLGALSLQKKPGDALTPTERKLLADLASQAGLVLRNVRLIEDLRASRQRLVAAQDEERRRLERNLHDCAQQQLVALQVKVRLADQIIDRDPLKAHALMADVGRDAGDALQELRDLARGIYPPLLADKGLPAALAAQARKSPVPVDVIADGVGRFPQEVEAAVYFSCLEALQNVAKYAAASGGVVRLAERGGELTFEKTTAEGSTRPPPATGPVFKAWPTVSTRSVERLRFDHLPVAGPG